MSPILRDRSLPEPRTKYGTDSEPARVLYHSIVKDSERSRGDSA